METVNVIFGVLYLTVGLGLTVTLVSRLYVYWQGFERAQKTLLIGVMVIMFGFTQRGIALLWFNGPDVTPAGYLSVTGALLALAALLMPVDKRLEPPSWQERMRDEDPGAYDKYMEILDKSAKARLEGSPGSEHYRTVYGNDNEADYN